ncbi:hypothetical protein E2542_SST26281 [Spatholobus suberectus]|nr:hypothetical protein E2542_SST26281 [Spatholobus suberectus]
MPTSVVRWRWPAQGIAAPLRCSVGHPSVAARSNLVVWLMDLSIFSVLCTRSIAFTAVGWGRDLRKGVGLCGGGDAAVAVRNSGEAFMLGVAVVCLHGAFRDPTTAVVPFVTWLRNSFQVAERPRKQFSFNFKLKAEIAHCMGTQIFHINCF